MDFENNRNDKLFYNYIMDLRKKEFSLRERADIIQEYLDKHNLSQISFARLIEVPHSTVQDWLMWNKISEEDYQEMKDSGLNDTQIYRNLRNHKKESREQLLKRLPIDIILEDSIKLIRPHIKITKYSMHTEDNIRKLINELNRMLMYIEKNNK